MSINIEQEEPNLSEPDIKPDRSVLNFAIAMGTIVLLLILISIYADDIQSFFKPEQAPETVVQHGTEQLLEQSQEMDDQEVKASLTKFIEAFYVDQRKGYFDPPSYFAPLTQTYFNYHNLTYQGLKQVNAARLADLKNLELIWQVPTLSFEHKNDTLVATYWTQQSYFKPSKNAQETAQILLEMRITKEGKICSLKELEIRLISSQFLSKETEQTADEAPVNLPEPANTEVRIKAENENGIYSSGTLDVAPSFPGGEKKLARFLGQSINYPSQALEKRVQGRVFISFIVEPSGELSNLKVVRGIGAGCDEEALRVLRKSPRWSPGIADGKPVRSSYILPILFQLAD
jgi:TonB family protein